MPSLFRIGSVAGSVWKMKELKTIHMAPKGHGDDFLTNQA